MFTEKGNWFMGKRYVGEVDGFDVETQVFNKPSMYGIAEGRFSRLQVYPDRSAGFGRCPANYDRGQDGGPPKDRRIRSVVEKTVRDFDGKNVDWSFEERRYQDSRDQRKNDSRKDSFTG